MNPEALEKFDRYLSIARETGIRLIPTGPDHWEGVPDYDQPDMFCGPEVFQALDYFWSQMAARYRDEPAIFAWDLRNEPMVKWDGPFMRQGWQTYLKERYGSDQAVSDAWDGAFSSEESLEKGTVNIPEDRPSPNDPRVYDYQLYREQVARKWTERQVRAIRQAGDRHMVTIGYIQWSFPGYLGSGSPSGYGAFRPSVLADLLDFDCAHFYPMFGGPANEALTQANLHYLLDWLRFCDTSRPILLEEYGWYGGGVLNEDLGYYSLEQQVDWNRRLLEATKGVASGWLCWPFADTRTSTDMSRLGGMVDAQLQPKPWGLFFRQYAEQLRKEPPVYSADRKPLKWTEEEFRYLVTSGGDQSLYWKG